MDYLNNVKESPEVLRNVAVVHAYIHCQLCAFAADGREPWGVIVISPPRSDERVRVANSRGAMSCHACSMAQNAAAWRSRAAATDAISPQQLADCLLSNTCTVIINRGSTHERNYAHSIP